MLARPLGAGRRCAPSHHRQHKQLKTLCRSGLADTDDLYGILDVPATASLSEIKAAYRRLVHDLHPDKHAHKQKQVSTASEAFLRCKLAYEVLSDADQRREYDQAKAAAAAGGLDAQQGPSASQPWSPYNGWMDAYGNSSGSSQHGSEQDTYSSSSAYAGTAGAAADYYQAMAEAATATAAAGASNSGLADFADPVAAALQGAGGVPPGQGLQEQHTAAAVRAALLDQHGMACEQFGSMQEALAALAEQDQQQVVVGLAQGDYEGTSWQD